MFVQIGNFFRKERRTCRPPTPSSHFWYLTEVKPRFSARTRCSSFNDARSALAVIWAYLLYLSSVLVSKLGISCIKAYVNNVLQAVMMINGAGNFDEREQRQRANFRNCPLYHVADDISIIHRSSASSFTTRIHTTRHNLSIRSYPWFIHGKYLFLDPIIYRIHQSLGDTSSGMANITWHYVFKFIITGALNE